MRNSITTIFEDVSAENEIGDENAIQGIQSVDIRFNRYKATTFINIMQAPLKEEWQYTTIPVVEENKE
jgi:hypothetical protein